MSASLPTIDDLDVAGKTVLLRADLNVPLEGGGVADDFRIRSLLPTLAELRARAAKVVVMSHLGRPHGRQAALRMDPVANRLSELSGFAVHKLSGVVGAEVAAAVTAAQVDTVVMLENTRFEPGETTNAAELADGMAALADVFVNDAFGSSHRAHASTVGVAERLPAAAGRLLVAEVDAFARLLGSPPRPYVVVLGGAKVADKLGLIRNLLPLVDLMLVGGGMCFTLLAAGGYQVGESLVDESRIDEVGDVLGSEYGGKVVLPRDLVVAERFAADAAYETVAATAIPAGGVGVDVGPETVAQFGGVITEAESVFWNGPMGVFEWVSFSSGTAGIATAVASSDGYTVVGGGDSVAALRALGLGTAVSHLSSGGGAGLEMLEGRTLPGIEVLKRRRPDA